MMAQGGRSFLSSLSKLLRGVFMKTSKPRFVGRDLDGNYYFESQPAPGSQRSRTRRFVTPDAESDPEATGTIVPNVPSEWEAWLRGRRKEPPSDEEQLRIVAMMAVKKARAKELDEKAAMERKGLLAEGAIQPEAEKQPQGVAGAAGGEFPMHEGMERFPGEAAHAYETREAEEARKRAERELREKLERVQKAQRRDKQ